MDKFKELQDQIKQVIEKIDTQIETRKMRLASLDEEIKFEQKEIKELTEKYQSLMKRRENINKPKKKTSFLSKLKSLFNQFIDFEKEMIEKKKWFYLLGVNVAILAALAVIITNPIILFLTLTVVGIYGLGTIISTLALNETQPTETKESIEEELRSTQEKKKEKEKSVARLSNKREGINTLIGQLHNEKAYYEQNLRRISISRGQVIREQVIPILNEAFKSYDKEEVMARMRAREKKEQRRGSI